MKWIKRLIKKILYMCIGDKNDPIRRVEELKRNGMDIGENVHIYNSFIDSKYYSLIEIGNNVTITNATILAHDASTKKFIGYTRVGKVIIGNNVFIGYGSIILPETVIGNDVIIGAGTVVKGIVPSNSVIVGNPWRILCETQDYIIKNKKVLNEDTIFDVNLDLEKMKYELNTKKGFIS